ncbi:hypothetical protein HJ590_13240 [Naumannella sp. ID2617S]|nr:hypothetical protein [Naumannella sp. ID2617S]
MSEGRLRNALRLELRPHFDDMIAKLLRTGIVKTGHRTVRGQTFTYYRYDG